MRPFRLPAAGPVQPLPISARCGQGWIRGALVLAVLMLGLHAARAQTGKAAAPIPAATLGLMAAKGTGAAAPMLIRAFKKEAEIELWKRTGDGRFIHVKTYPICRWSGQLGPKTREGDRQTPEGFYSVAKDQMNPNSRYYLSFDIGYPNAFERSRGYTGSAVMVHGICSSMGCFAMTDKVAGELFAVAREAFAGGQQAFQFQSFPFRMSAKNMALYRGDPNIGFWRVLKEGSDRFEATGLEVATTIAGARYGFLPYADPTREALATKHVRQETAAVAALVEDGAASIRTTYIDGGQHPFWASLIGRGVSVGPVSRPDALAHAGLEVVLIPERRKPTPMPDLVWVPLIAPGTRFFQNRVAGSLPAYDAPPPRFAPMAVGYESALPRLLGADLKGEFASPFDAQAAPTWSVVAAR